LNFPPNHPARDTQDTLFIAGQDSKPQRDRCCCARTRLRCRFVTMQKMKRRCASCVPEKFTATMRSSYTFAHLSSGRRLAVDTNIHVLRPEGHARPRMKALFDRASRRVSIRRSFRSPSRAPTCRSVAFFAAARARATALLPQLQGQRMD